MKKLLSITLLASLFFSFVVPSVHAETPKENVIIVYKNGVTQKEKVFKNVNGEVKDVFKNIPVATGKVPKSAIALLKKNKDILAVEIDQKIQIKGQTEDWGIQVVNAPASWKSEFTGKGIKIAVLDTGISPHEDLIVTGGVSFVSYTTSYADDNGHGQHVGGIIGAENNGIGTVGSAPDADIYAVKVLDKNGMGYLSDIIRGIEWSITNKMNIINLSLGTTSHALSLQQAVDKAYNSGILVVAAAGNNGNIEGSGDTVEYPARYDSAIAVSAIDTFNNRGSFSATGSTLEVSAPGVRILSTCLNNQYCYMSGTSMATPYVAGTLALLKQANPTLSQIQLREKLKETVIDLGVAGKDAFFGFGLVQAPVLVQKVKEVPNTEEAQEQSVIQGNIPAPEPENTLTKPSPKKNLVSTIKTSKSTYLAGSNVMVNIMTVDRDTKKPIGKSIIKLTITPPKGKAKVVILKTNSKGVASYKMVTDKITTVKGNYKLTTSTIVANYSVNSVSKTIKIQ